MTAGGSGNWNPQLHTFASFPDAIYHAYVRQIGAGAVAAGGLITLIKTFPTIISSFRGSVDSLKQNKAGAAKIIRTENDLSFKTVIGGSIGLVIIMVVLPIIPGDTIINKFLLGILSYSFRIFLRYCIQQNRRYYWFKFQPNFRNDHCNFDGNRFSFYCCRLDG